MDDSSGTWRQPAPGFVQNPARTDWPVGNPAILTNVLQGSPGGRSTWRPNRPRSVAKECTLHRQVHHRLAPRAPSQCHGGDWPSVRRLDRPAFQNAWRVNLLAPRSQRGKGFAPLGSISPSHQQVLAQPFGACAATSGPDRWIRKPPNCRSWRGPLRTNRLPASPSEARPRASARVAAAPEGARQWLPTGRRRCNSTVPPARNPPPRRAGEQATVSRSAKPPAAGAPHRCADWQSATRLNLGQQQTPGASAAGSASRR